MDSQGRKSFDYDDVADLAGHDYADRYIGPPEQTRATRHDEAAQYENELMFDGADIEPLDGQDHMTHLRWHVSAMLDSKDAVENGEMDLVDYALRYVKVWEHTNKTLAEVQIDETVESEVNEMVAQVQRLGEFIHNGMEQARAEQQDAENNQEETGLSDEQKKTISFQAEEQRKQMAFQMEQQRKNAESAAKVARENAIAEAKAVADLV